MNIAVMVPHPGHTYSRMISEADNMMMILFAFLFSSLLLIFSI
jgi:hypothetical protein